MGEKQNRRGKHFYFFFACVILIQILLSGCAHFYDKFAAGPDFKQADDFTKQGKYEAAADKYEQIIDRYPQAGDRALFQAGIIYVLPQNRHKDYYKALGYLQSLADKYPKSTYRQDSDLLVSLLNEIVAKERKLVTQHKQIYKLEQQTEEIEKKLEQMKKVDMNLKQRKKTFP